MIKRKQSFLWILTIIALAFLIGTTAFARENDKYLKGKSSLAKSATDGTVQTMTNIGNWGYWFAYNGVSASDPFTGGSGGYYPRGTAGAIYRDGLVWGGLVQDPSSSKPKLRVGGNTYRCATQAGWIVTPGDGTNDPVAIDADDQDARLYRIRSDWATLTKSVVLKDAAELNNLAPGAVTDAQANAIIDSYKEDWKNWPTDLGAPYYDVNDNGVYDPVLDGDGMPIAGILTLPDGTEIVGNDYPGIANADQVTYFVINDMNAANVLNLTGSPSIGLECQTTAWAYNQPTAGLGQIVFKKYKIINKSGFRIDSMYICQWCDPDLGDYGDDLTGCDTTLSMMFAYNGYPADNQYSNFNLAPAAVGYDFFQGPMIATGEPSDTAVFDLKKVSGHINLPMTSFGYFGSGTVWTDPDMGEDGYNGTLQWYNLLRGYAPTLVVDDPTYFLVTTGDNEGDSTLFPLAGDPVAQTGDYDGVKYQPGDRRMLQSTGPFVMENLAVQEIVVAVVGGLGSNNISSVADMKSTDDVAQTVYNSLFQVVPKPPEAPQVKLSALDDHIVLNWGSNEAAVKATEDKVIINYEFEGYNVYQLASATASIADETTVRLATYDLVNGVRIIKTSMFSAEYGTIVELPVQFGGDTGLQRYINIERDYINNQPFYRGSTYYFAVTAYNYDPALVRDRSLESSATVFAITPQDPLPGDRYGVDASGTEVEVTHTGPSDGQVYVSVIEPAVLTGSTYHVFFEEDVDTNSATYGEILYGVLDSTNNTTVLSEQTQVQSLTDGAVINVDGLNVVVAGPPEAVKAVYETDAADVIVDERVSIAIPVAGTGGSLGSTGYIVSNRAGLTSDIGNYERDYDRFDYWGMDDLEIDFGGTSLTWDYSSEEVHFDSTDGSPYYAPFAVYRHIFATGEKQRLFAGFWDTDGDGLWSPPNGDWEGGVYHEPAYEPIYCWVGYDPDGNEISYDPANDATYIADNWLGEPTTANTTWGAGTGEFHYPYVTATLFGMYLGDATLPLGNKVWFITTKPNTLTDIFSFSVPASSYSEDLAKEDVDKVNVFPNPYYGDNPLETSRFNHFVTFNHLPQNAEFRIFNLAGIQVRKLEKDTPEQFFQWDLLNEEGLPVASGVYIVHIDMKELGKTKILKLFIVQPQQILEYY